MRTCFCTFSLLFFILFSVQAQLPVSVDLQAGLIIGTPYGPPPSTVIFAAGDPSVELKANVILNRQLTGRLSFSAGIGYARKGSKFRATIKDRYNVGRDLLGLTLNLPLDIEYTARTEGEFDNRYLDIPLYLNGHWKRWIVSFGYQYSRLLEGSYKGTVEVTSGPFDITTQDFDESELLKSNDHALLMGLGRMFGDRFRAEVQFAYGISEIFTTPPEGANNMRNYYGNVLVSYRLVSGR